MKHQQTRWEHSTEDTCPRCKGETDFLCVDEDGETYHLAERCQSCEWVFDFDKMELHEGTTEAK